MDRDYIRGIVLKAVDEFIKNSKPCQEVRVAIGADHGGFRLKEILKPFIQELGYAVVDVGTCSTDSCDYPDFAKKVAMAVQSRDCARGIMIDGAGIGSSMVCNKFRGIRAALCYDMATILNSRQHNDANLLTLGANANSPQVTKELVKAWLATAFEGGRHARRVEKIETGTQA